MGGLQTFYTYEHFTLIQSGGDTCPPRVRSFGWWPLTSAGPLALAPHPDTSLDRQSAEVLG
jgi:hypothetical protein